MNQLQMLKRALIAYVNSVKAVWSDILYPLSIISKRNGVLKDYRIYGNTVQNGEPSPEAPVEMQSVGELTNKNLWRGDNYIVSNSSTKACLNYVYPDSSNPWVVSGNTVTISATICIKDARTNTRISVGTQLVDGTILDTKQARYTSYGDEIRVSLAYTIPQSDVEIQRLQIRFTDYSGNTEGVWDGYVKDIQIEYGDTATPYEPYNKYRIGVVARGKNIFKLISSSVQNATTIETFENGAIVQGKSSDTASNDSYARGWFSPGYKTGSAILPVFRGGETVTVSADITLLELLNGTSYRPLIMLYSENGSTTATKPSNQTKYIAINEKTRVYQTFVIKDTEEPLAYRPIFTLNSNVVRIENIQIEKGDTDSKYEDYIEPQTFNIFLDEPLRKVPDASDYIDFEKKLVVRNLDVKTLVGDSTEGWYRENYRLFTYLSPAPTSTDSDKVLCLSNRFKESSWTYLYGNSYRTTKFIGIAIQGGGILVVTPAQEIPSAAEWKGTLARWNEEGNPLTVVRWNDNAPNEKIELPKLPQFKGTTVYEVDTTVKPSGMKVCYYE